MAYEPLHHKYRPQRFNQLVGQEAIATTLSNALRTGRIAPAYLFTGPRGTGKTSSARILARSLNCIASAEPTPEPCGSCELCRSIASGSALDVIEIDAASNTGVDNIRDLIERSRFAPVQARWKVYVVDECHMLSTAAFNALLKTLEEPPPQVVFVLATTDPQRVLPTILSRCQRFDFRRIPVEAMEQHLSWIAKQEAIEINPAAIHLVAQMAQGGLRDAESLLDQLSLLPAPVEPDAVWELLGAVPEQELLGLAAALAAADPVALLKNIRGLLDRGREATAVLQGIAGLLRDLVLAIAAPDQPELSSFSPANRAELPALANQLGRQKLLNWQQGLRGSETQLRQSAQPRLWLEVLLLGLLSEPAISSAPVVTKSIHTQVEIVVKNEAPQKAPVINNEIVNNETINNEVVNNKSQDLAVIWQQILASLELPSTRMLLSQQGELVRLDRSKAVVRVAPNWVAMVQSRLPLLEQATTKALGETRQVIIETGSAQVLDAQISKEITKPVISITTPKPISTPAAPVSIQKTEAISKTTHSNGIEVEAKRLAEFFNGEVVLAADDSE